MNKNQLSRLERLEEAARHWKADNAEHKHYWMDNNTVTPSDGDSGRIEFETVRDALEWTLKQLTGGATAQIYVDDVRDVMDDDERAVFDAVYFDAPDYKVVFDLRGGQDVLPAALWMWKNRTLAGVKHSEWWNSAEPRQVELMQRLENYRGEHAG